MKGGGQIIKILSDVSQLLEGPAWAFEKAFYMHLIYFLYAAEHRVDVQLPLYSSVVK